MRVGAKLRSFVFVRAFVRESACVLAYVRVCMSACLREFVRVCVYT